MTRILFCIFLTSILFSSIRAQEDPQFTRPVVSPDGTSAVFAKKGQLKRLNIRTGEVKSLPISTPGTKHRTTLRRVLERKRRLYRWFPDSRRVLVRSGGSDHKWVICDTSSGEVEDIYKTAPRSRAVPIVEPGPNNPVEHTRYDFARIDPSGKRILFVRTYPGKMDIYHTGKKQWKEMPPRRMIRQAGWIRPTSGYVQDHYGTASDPIHLFKVGRDSYVHKIQSQGFYELSPDREWLLDLIIDFASNGKLHRIPSGTKHREISEDQWKGDLTGEAIWGPDSNAFAVGLRRATSDSPPPGQMNTAVPGDGERWIRLYRIPENREIIEQEIIKNGLLDESFQALLCHNGRWLVYARDRGARDSKNRYNGGFASRKVDLAIRDRKKDTSHILTEGPLFHIESRQIGPGTAAFTASSPEKHTLCILEYGKEQSNVTRVVERTDGYVPIPTGAVLDGSSLLVSYLRKTEEGWKTVRVERRSIRHPDQAITLLEESE